MHVFSCVHFLTWNWGYGATSVKIVGLSNSVHSPELFLVSIRIERNKTWDLEQTRTGHRLTQWTNWFDTTRTPDLILHTWHTCRRSCRYRTAMPHTQFIDVETFPDWEVSIRCLYVLFPNGLIRFIWCTTYHVDGLHLKFLSELNFVLKRSGIYHSFLNWSITMCL